MVTFLNIESVTHERLDSPVMINIPYKSLTTAHCWRTSRGSPAHSASTDVLNVKYIRGLKILDLRKRFYTSEIIII